MPRGSFMSTTRMPVRPLIENVPPIAMVISADRSVPTASIGKPMSTSARLKGPRSPSPAGSEGCGAGFSMRIASTCAATRAFSSSVSPGKATKVPVDWSLAILAASASMLADVSIR